MTDQIPLKAIKTGSTATALAEFAAGDTIPAAYLSGDTVAAVAGIALDYPRVVAVNAGSAYYPDLTDPSDVARIVGVTTHAAAIGAAIAITTAKTFTESGWAWSPGRLYCALSGGTLTQSVPATGAVLEVARVISPTTIRVGIQPAILR